MQFPRNYSNLDDTETLEHIHDYLELWRDHEGYSDLNLMLDKGLTELAAYTLIESGAIDHTLCVEWAKATEKAIEKLVKNYKAKRRASDLKEFWNGTTVWINEFNERYFINSEIHFVDDSSLIEWGFKKQEGRA